MQQEAGHTVQQAWQDPSRPAAPHAATEAQGPKLGAAHLPSADVPRDQRPPRVVPGHRKLTLCERVNRGFLMGVRDLAATTSAAGVRLGVGAALASLRNKSATYIVLTGVSLYHLGVFAAIKQRIGPLVQDSSEAARERRIKAERWSHIASNGMMLGAAAMVPAVLLAEKTSTEQTAMKLALVLIMQSVGNLARDWVVCTSKKVLPPTTLEMADPRVGDDPQDISKLTEWTRTYVLITNSLAYMVVLLGTGWLDDTIQAGRPEDFGNQGNDTFPVFDRWLTATALSSGAIYMLAEVLDQWAGQALAMAVQAHMGMAQYRSDPSVTGPMLPADAGGDDDAAVVAPLPERLVTPLRGWRSQAAEVLINASGRSVVVFAGALPSWLLKHHLARSPDHPRLDTERIGWFQATRALLALTEARGVMVQSIARCALITLSNADAINVARANGFEELAALKYNRRVQLQATHHRESLYSAFHAGQTVRNLVGDTHPDAEAESPRPQDSKSDGAERDGVKPGQGINVVVIHNLPNPLRTAQRASRAQ